jgi:PAS domain-containing protein
MQENLRPQRLLAAILSFSDEALLTFALDRTVQTWSRGAEKLYGYAATERRLLRSLRRTSHWRQRLPRQWTHLWRPPTASFISTNATRELAVPRLLELIPLDRRLRIDFFLAAATFFLRCLLLSLSGSGFTWNLPRSFSP